MSSRRSNRVSTLAIVLPRPALPRRSSLLSQGSASSPRTPRSSGCASPTCHSWFLATSSNRKSIDSWNSSNQDVGEDCDSEWKPDQVLLLSRTLDALPSHLVTPFNGPIPPSNLLDKIARGVANAKGPVEWPHSLRATRVKLIEICRQRAREEAQTPLRTVTDENDDIACYNPDSDVSMGDPNRKNSIRRPLYRQSSMDFMNTEDPKNASDRINRLSTRLQRTDNIIPNSSYHPYTRSRSRAQTQTQTQASRKQLSRRSSSPPRPAHIPSLMSPSTPSSSTLNSLSSISTSAARPHLLRRTASSLTTSDSSMISGSRSSVMEEDSNLLPSVIPPVDPRVQRVRRSESFCAPSPTTSSFISPTKDEFPFPIVSARTPPPHRQTFKRAPSYGTLAQEAREREKEKRMSGVSDSRDSMQSPCPSSDEEEKLRSKQAKKPRADIEVSTSATKPKTKKTTTKVSSRSESKSSPTKPSRATPTPAPSASTRPRPPPLRMNLQRNPSMFGEELPHLHIPAPAPASSSRAVPPTPATQAPEAPRTVKTLRRVKRLKAPSRKISFGSLIAPPGEEADIEEEGEQTLGSAFQLA